MNIHGPSLVNPDADGLTLMTFHAVAERAVRRNQSAESRTSE